MLDSINNPYQIATGMLSLINLILLVVLYQRIRQHRKGLKEIFDGENTGKLEEVVLKHKKTLTSHNKNLKEIGKLLEEMVEQNKFNIQKAGVVRFNPFADTGGNMSFSLALLDGNDNGIVISSLHSREGTRIYAKPVEKRKSSMNLTEEEKRAIASANSRL
jgi:hypothetical protein